MIESELLHYGYLFVIAGTILEGDATLLTAAFLAHRGYFRLSLVLALAGVATIASSHVYFAAARRAGPKLLAAYEERGGTRTRKIVEWSRTNGGLLVLASRFMVGFRTLVPVVCGATNMPAARFAAWNLAGAVIWTVLFGSIGYAGGHVAGRLLHDLQRHEKLFAVLVAVAVAGAVLWRTHGRELADLWTLRRASR
ncbi:MAG: DedA family protein [Bryobacteraceae bacterium]